MKNAFDAIHAIVSVLIVEVIGFAAGGPWGLLAGPVIIGAFIAKRVYDENQLETLRQEMLAAQEELAQKREAERVAKIRLDEAIERKNNVRKLLKDDGWMVPTSDDAPIN